MEGGSLLKDTKRTFKLHISKPLASGGESNGNLVAVRPAALCCLY